jgi:transposase InsO family protein
MVIMFNDSQLGSLEEVQKFLDGAGELTFQPLVRDERSQWIRKTLIRFKYAKLKRKNKHVVRKYIERIAGLSPSQVTRHIQSYKKGRNVCISYERNSFHTKYTQIDVELLAATDNLHQRLNAAATITIMRTEYECGDERYERLKNISVAHLYRLRGTRRYRNHSTTYEKTNPVSIPIGERRKPQPKGKPGFIRVDSVHQGDCKGKKGVYHINCVDEVTQWQVPIAVENLQEACVEPALEEAFLLFPFGILNFHSDNGSEYINYIVQAFLKRWSTKQTKSRPRRSNDNGLVETKNGAIIRKHMTHYHIPQPFAARINQFYREHLIPYLNFHRPCAFPKTEISSNGKKKITYPKENYMTPYAKLKSLPNWTQYLRRGITTKMLERQAQAKTPNQAAKDMQKAKKKLFGIILPHYRYL